MDRRWMRVLTGLLLAVSLVVFCGCRGNRLGELIGQQAPDCTVTLLDAFRVSVLPVTLLIDGQGIIRYHHAGQFSLPSMEGQINRLLATNRPPG